MKFNAYFESQRRDIWLSQYIKYKELKQLLHEALETGAPVVVPQVLCLSINDPAVARARASTPQERFFVEVESQVAAIDSFTQAQARLLRDQLRRLENRLRNLMHLQDPEAYPMSPVSARVGGLAHQDSGPRSRSESGDVPPGARRRSNSTSTSSLASGSGRLTSWASGQHEAGPMDHGVAGPSTPQKPHPNAKAQDAQSSWAQLQADAQAVGREYLALEKYVNLNYAAVQKILQKHDKLLPNARCWGFYRIHISSQPWVQGEHHDIQVTLARVFTHLHAASRLRRSVQLDRLAEPLQSVTDAQQNTLERSRKFWFKLEDLAEIEYSILQHLPVCGLPPGDSLDAQQGGQGGTGIQVPDFSHRIVNLLYLDNSSLELYHNLLYGRPYATLIRLRWVGDELAPSDRVVLQRKVYSEGWRLDVSAKDAFPLPSRRVAEFVSGRWTFADARKYLLQKQQENQRLLSRASLTLADVKHSSGSSGSHSATNIAAGPSSSGTGPRSALSSKVASRLSPFATSSSSPGFHDPTATSQPQSSAVQPLAAAVPPHNALSSLTAEMEATQREYALFKTFTEVQRLVETKALQPVVRVRMRQTVYGDVPDPQSQAAAEGSTWVSRVQVDTHIRALLEYSYDGKARMSHGLWRQAHNTDCVDFPYGCVSVVTSGLDLNGLHDRPDHLHDHSSAALPGWLQRLVDSGKLLEVPDYSKVLFACAGLLPDMVRAVPVWIDDPLVAQCLADQVLGTGPSNEQAASQQGSSAPQGIPIRQLSHRHPHHSSSLHETSSMPGSTHPNGSVSLMGSSSDKRGRNSSTGQGRGGDVAGSLEKQASSLSKLSSLKRQGSMHMTDAQQTASPHAASMTAGSMPQGGGWQLKLLARQQSKGRVYAPQALFIEPGQFLRNERIFITWLRMCITLSGIACGMLGFAASAVSDPSNMSAFALVEVSSLILLAAACAMCAYGLATFLWRGSSLYELRPHRYDDTRGSMTMNLMLIGTLSLLFLLNVYDFVENLTHPQDPGQDDYDDDDGGGGDDPAAPPPPMRRAMMMVAAGQTMMARCIGRPGGAEGSVARAAQEAACAVLKAVGALRGQPSRV